MHIKPFKAVYPDTDMISDILEYTVKVRNSFSEMEDSLRYSNDAHFILYNIDSDVIQSRGLICLTNIRDYKDGNILKHEKTLEEKELEQVQLISSRRSMVKPVLLTYPANEWFDQYLESLKNDGNKIQSFRFDDKGEVHTFWKVDANEDIEKISKFFDQEIKRVYIADGHHRLSTFARFSDDPEKGIGEFVLSVYIPFSGLNIHPFNRIITLGEKIREKEILSEVSKLCFVEKLEGFFEPKFKYNFILSVKDSVYSCIWKPSLLEKYKEEPLVLDSALLNAVLFRQLFHVTDVRTDERIRYVEGFKGWEGFLKALGKNRNSIGFYLYPVDFEDFQKVSDLGLTLPPKSTWFEPRIRNGLVIHDFRSQDQ